MNATKICLSLYGTTEEIIGAISAHDADLFEVRLDLSAELNGPQIRAATRKPLLFTAHRRPDLLERFWPFADYVDVEQADATGRSTIRSIHAGEEDPEALWNKLCGEHMTKIVLETENYKTISRLIKMNREHVPLALCFASGEAGSFSRIVSVLEGARWLYASLPGRATAPGQFTFDELIHVYQLRRFQQGQNVLIFGILGNPVFQSRSPQIQNQNFADASLPWIYLPFLCKDLSGLMENAHDWNSKAFSVTHPYKEDVIRFLDVASPEVLALRSCNTTAFVEGKWHGTNTDVEGIRALLKEVPLSGKRVVILGAGASSRAVAMVVRSVASEVTVLNRTVAKADGSLSDLANIEYDVLINATPVGWKEGECPINPDHLRTGKIVIDAVYQDTELLKRARSAGCATWNGEIWFKEQADAQFRFWRGLFNTANAEQPTATTKLT